MRVPIQYLVNSGRKCAVSIAESVYRCNLNSIRMIWNVVQNRVRRQKLKSFLVTMIIAILWSLSRTLSASSQIQNNHLPFKATTSSRLQSFQIRPSDMKVFRDPSGYSGLYARRFKDKERIAHVDLSSMPIKSHYLIMLLREFRKFNITGIVLEYGNTFPYYGRLQSIVSPNAYTTADILAITEACHQYQLKVIIMLPMLGSFDYVLKNDRFRQYRMNGEDTRSLCICYPPSLALAEEIIKQMLDLHRHSNYIHVGGIGGSDIATCRYCSKDEMKSSIYASFLSPLLHRLKEYRSPIQIMLWDDALRSWPTDQLSHIAKWVIPVVGGFYPNIEDLIDPLTWQKYAQAFPSIWIGGTYKGMPDCSNDTIVGVDHISNTISWMRVVGNHYHQVNFQGIILVGPAFSTTTDRICELLPHCAPTLAVLMWVMISGGYNIDHNRDVSLCVTKCTDAINIEIKPDYAVESCDYHGGSINRLVTQLQILNLKVNQFRKLYQNDTILLNAKKNPLYASLAKDNARQLSTMIKSLKDNALILLSDAYRQNDIERWIAQAIQPLYDDINSMQKRLT